MKDRLDIKDTLFSIDDVSTMRANTLAIDHEEMKEGNDRRYTLQT